MLNRCSGYWRNVNDAIGYTFIYTWTGWREPVYGLLLYFFDFTLASAVLYYYKHTPEYTVMATAVSSVPRGSENRGAVGAYKDFQIHKINKEAELHGTDNFKAASFPHYLPTWENEKGKQ